MQFRFILLIAMAAAVITASANTAATRARITFEDLASIEQLGAPVLSPAGTEFALVRSGQLAVSAARIRAKHHLDRGHDSETMTLRSAVS
jgi:hypothetical protein